MADVRMLLPRLKSQPESVNAYYRLRSIDGKRPKTDAELSSMLAAARAICDDALLLFHKAETLSKAATDADRLKDSRYIALAHALNDAELKQLRTLARGFRRRTGKLMHEPIPHEPEERHKCEDQIEHILDSVLYLIHQERIHLKLVMPLGKPAPSK